MELKNKNMAYQITLAVGVVLLLIAIFLAYHSIEFVKNAEKVSGKVIELEKIYRTGKTKATYKPIFEFVTIDGAKIIYKPNSSSNPPAWKVGEEAVYAYTIEKPNNGKIVNYFGVFAWSIALACLAMPCLIIGGGFFMSNSFFESILKTM